MDQILRAIHDAKCTGDLYPALNALSAETERIVNTHPLNAEQARSLAQYLTEIRLLLTRISGVDIGPGGDDRNMAAKRLAALYGEIEGRVKEIRNDLEGKKNVKRSRIRAPGL